MDPEEPKQTQVPVDIQILENSHTPGNCFVQFQEKGCSPSTAVRFGFWLILGMCSTTFAEVTCCSDLFPFFHSWGVVAVLPLYTLHSLVLASIVWRWGKPRWEVLYFAGMLFGLYEAYLTKQLWNPTWETVWKLGGVSVLDTIVLVAFWHVVFAFILPLLATESWLCQGNSVFAGMPAWLHRAFQSANARRSLLAIAIIWGLIHLGTEPDWDVSVLALLGNGTIIVCACLLWHWVTRGRRYTMEQLLPTRREVFMLLIPLGIHSSLLTFGLRFEALPGIGPQLIVLVLYCITAMFLWLALHQSRSIELGRVEIPDLSWRGWMGLALVAIAIPILGKALLGESVRMVMIVCWFGYIGTGLVLVVSAMRIVLMRILIRSNKQFGREIE